jgi:type II secretory ATPase GspE/PulE/Tfp pilus assembly ATPase PilB-like protein
MVGTLISESFVNINQYLEKLDDAPAVFDMGTEFNADDELVDGEALDAEINRSRLINLFEAALVEAVTRGASDLHIFPNSDGHVEIHMRIDGDLEQWHLEDNVRPEAFLSVVKDNSTNVDRFDRDSAQDGFIQRWVDGTLIRFRVSILPIASAKQEVHAESIVIRILDDRKVLTDLSKIGLNGVAMERFDQAIRQPNGMVILTGPTGSGKSTTLVAALYQVVTSKVNVLTVEDPVEYLMKGIRQIKLSHKLDLEGALRAILRHDPDIVMVGEMRDQHTAELAIKLANTGHLTFSTLHTNDAPSAVSRLFKMGVEPFLIAYAINLVVAQRLVRKLCPDCKTPEGSPVPATLSHLGFTDEELSSGQLYKAGTDTSCPTCKGAGFKGRRAVAETLMFTSGIRNIIMASEDTVDEDRLREAAVAEGMMTLTDCGRAIAMEGETTIDEVLRVTGSAT